MAFLDWLSSSICLFQHPLIISNSHYVIASVLPWHRPSHRPGVLPGGQVCACPGGLGQGSNLLAKKWDCFVGLPDLLATTHPSPMSSPPPPRHLVPPFLVLKWGTTGGHSFLIRIKKSNLNSPPSLLQAKPFPPPMSRRHPFSCRACRGLSVQSKRICSSFVPQKQIPPPPPRQLVPPFLILKRGDYRRAFVPLRVKKSNLNSPPSLLQAKPFPPPMSRRHPISCRAAASPRPPISGFEMGGPQGGMRSYSLRLPL